MFRAKKHQIRSRWWLLALVSLFPLLLTPARAGTSVRPLGLFHGTYTFNGQSGVLDLTIERVAKPNHHGVSVVKGRINGPSTLLHFVGKFDGAGISGHAKDLKFAGVVSSNGENISGDLLIHSRHHPNEAGTFDVTRVLTP